MPTQDDPPQHRVLTPSRLALLVGGAACYALSFPPFEIAAAAWLVAPCWIAALQGAEPRMRFWVTFLAGYAATGGSLAWLWNVFGVSVVFLWALVALYVGFWGLAASPPAHWPTALRIAWPAVAWCGLEYLRGELAPLNFSWIALGYSQIGTTATGLAAGVGVYGISFLMMLWGSALVHFWTWRRHRKWAVPTLIVLWIPFLIPRASASRPDSTFWTVELQQFREGDDPGEFPPYDAEPAERATLIVWPEYSFFHDPFDAGEQHILAQLQRCASFATWGLLVGALDVPEGKTRAREFRDTAFLFARDGSLAAKAGKNRPVPFMRDGLPADDVTIVELPVGGASGSIRGTRAARMGVGVCFDGAYQRFARRMAARRPDFLVFPTYNVAVWGTIQFRQHQRMFQMRAAETGLTVAVAAVSGPTFVARPDGSATDELPFGVTASVRAAIGPSERAPTLFTRGGWLVGPACVAALGLVLLLRAFLATRRFASAPAV